MKISARYVSEDGATVEAIIDGIRYGTIDLAADSYRAGQVRDWIAAGGKVAAYVAPELPARPVDGITFLGRFTDAELEAIYAAAVHDMQLQRWIEILRLRGSIEIAGTTAQAAKAGLIAAGLLTARRATAIFATE